MRTVVITGGTRGIGRAVAAAFCEAGAFVAVCGRDADAVEGTVAALNGEEAGDDGREGADSAGRAWGLRADVRDEYDVERFLEAVAGEAGPVDVLVANAAVNHADPGDAPLPEEPYSRFDDTMRTNARGVFATIREAVPHLADDARVLVPSGSVATEPKAGMGAYGASKAAAEGIARGFAADLDAAVGVVDPGLVATDLTGADRARDPADVAGMFLWAADDCPADDLDGGRVDLRAWKQATR